MVVTRDLGLVWADEYEPFGALKTERELQRLGLDFSLDDEPWDDIDDDGHEWDNEHGFDW